MDKFKKHHSDRSFSLDLEDFDVEHFNSLLSFLGEDDKCRYVDVVHDNAGRFQSPAEPLEWRMIAQERKVHCLTTGLAMSVCCADMMTAKVGPDAKPFVVQPLMEDSPVTTEFLTTMSGQLQNVQHVIDDVTTQIARLQQQINNKLGHVGTVVTMPTLDDGGSRRIDLPMDLDNITMQHAQGAGTRVLEPIAEPTPEPEDEISIKDKGLLYINGLSKGTCLLLFWLKFRKNKLCPLRLELPAVEAKEKKRTEADQEAIDELVHQFERCDVSTNGFVSAHELVALAFAHGEQLQLASRVQRISKQSLPAQQATRALLVKKVEQACAGWGCRLTDKGLHLLNQGLARLWPRVDEERVLEDAKARIAQLRHFHREAAMSSSSFTELCARFPEVFLDYSVKALWEDDGLLAVHKPWGMRAYVARKEGEQVFFRGCGKVLDSRSPTIKSGSWCRAWPEELTAHDLLRQICEGSRPRMCNRLDFATSGLMLVGKSREAAGKASRLFQQRRVLGHPPASWEKGVVLNYRIMDTSGFARKALDPKMEDTAGRNTENAETSVRVLKRGLWPPSPWQASFGGCGEGSPEEVTREPLPASLVEVSPKTGRRHQIRVHLAAAGHPVLGDDSYAGQPWGLRGGCHRMFLHSWKLELPWKDSVLSVEDPCDWRDGQLV
eukprot:s1171_g4.t4